MKPEGPVEDRPDGDAYISRALSAAIRQGFGALVDPPRGGAFASSNEFQRVLDDFDPPLSLRPNGEDIVNRELRAAYGYADAFFFNWDEGLLTHGPLQWAEARSVLESLLASLDSGATISDERVLLYARGRSDKPGWAQRAATALGVIRHMASFRRRE